MSSDYIKAKQAREIARFNRRETAKLEKKLEQYSDSERICEMKNPSSIVEFDDMHTYFYSESGVVKAVDGITFEIPKGKTVGVVGESGCGKSVTSLSLMRLLPRPEGQIVSGSVRLNTGKEVIDIAKTPPEKMGGIRGAVVSMIFQEPMTSLNPVLRIGKQLDEVIELHMDDLIERGVMKSHDKAAIKQRSVEMLDTVAITNPEGVYKMYPHELSGGMRQRVMIAMALACNPALIIADEPTTALDVTIQAQILDLLRELKNRINSSIMLITHDLGVVAEMADYVIVMYSGKIVERGTAREIYAAPSHPYTIGLMKSKPVPGQHVKRLYSIPGKVPNPINMPSYCYYKDRCEFACDKCEEYPKETMLSDTHIVSCWRCLENLGGEISEE
ncbi:MAG: ABC transporter ATP-binding protein [Clostridium sp.]|nr:ABC transporter ATP-binding protein [Clostridium sp.]